jgi:hypothetical protein
MSKLLRISPELAIPDDVVTATSVVYGGKGMGKTNLASVLVEEATKARLRWAVLDPMGVFWGLRHSVDGTGPGIECVILGGPHGDIPIEPTSGEIVADLVIDEGVNTVIDFSRKPSGEMWGKNEKVRFVTDYALRLFRRQGDLLPGNQRREPLLQILDEAARYIPQVIPHGAIALAECVGAWEQIGEEGRNIGLGVCFLTQRSARMNKSVSELADVMFAFRTIGPNSLAAVMDWLGEHIEKSRIREVASQVRELEVGQSLVVSPGWLRVEKVVKIRARETFDSSATPKPGQRARKVTGHAAKPDLAKYRERMASTIEKAKADDPKELRKQLAEKDSQIRRLEKGGATKTVEKPVVDQAAIARAVKAETASLRRALEAAMKFIINISTQNFDVAGVDKAELERAVSAAVTKAASMVEQRLEARSKQLEILRANAQKIVLALKNTLNDDTPVEISVGVTKNEPFSVKAPAVRAEVVRRAVRPPEGSDSELTGLPKRIVDSLAELEAIGIDRPTREQLAFYLGTSAGGGYMRNVLGQLQTSGRIQYPENGRVALTDEGRGLAAAVEPPVTLDEFHARVRKNLTGLHERIFNVLVSWYPDSNTRETLAQAVGTSQDGGYFRNVIGQLSTAGLLEYPAPGLVRASNTLFPESLA